MDNTGLSDAEREAIRIATTKFRDASHSGRSGVEAMRESTQALRNRAVSQEINRATEYRLLPALDDVISTLRSLERSCLRILRMAQESPSGAQSTVRKKGRPKNQ